MTTETNARNTRNPFIVLADVDSSPDGLGPNIPKRNVLLYRPTMYHAGGGGGTDVVRSHVYICTCKPHRVIWWMSVTWSRGGHIGVADQLGVWYTEDKGRECHVANGPDQT